MQGTGTRHAQSEPVCPGSTGVKGNIHFGRASVSLYTFVQVAKSSHTGRVQPMPPEPCVSNVPT